MNKKLKFLIKTSLKKKIGSKWFLGVNILLVTLIIGLINIDNVINFFGGSFNKAIDIVVIDNTDKSYELFKSSMKTENKLIGEINLDKINVIKSEKNEEEETKDIKDNKKIVVVFDDDEEEIIKAKIISNSYIETILHQKIISSINVVKSSLAILKYNIKVEELAKINTLAPIERIYLDESKTQSEENTELIMSVIFPTIILPFFMLIVFMVQILGAEINEEKTTRGMEIIISNVSPQTHFVSKIIASNLFVLIQGSILFLSALIGIFIRTRIGTTGSILPEGINLSSLWQQLVESGFADKLIYIIPLTLLLIILSFIAYSLLAGILASMTTSMEDYQQIQTPIILVCLAGYYLSILAPIFEGSIFIRFISYLPFVSALMAPALLVIGHIGIIDILISIFLLIGVIYFMATSGLKVYKVGILNYSTTKLWSKMFKALKEK